MSPQPVRQRSTGPRTAAGKAASSRNALRHGLASSTLIMPGEDAAAYARLEQSLLAQFTPANPVETILVTSMARHHWLSLRAMRLQAEVLSVPRRKREELPLSLALLHRYQVSNDRAFHKCFETLQTLRKQQLAGREQFVPQRIASRPQPTPATPLPNPLPDPPQPFIPASAPPETLSRAATAHP